MSSQSSIWRVKRSELTRSAKGRVAPLANLDCLEVAVTRPFDEGQDYTTATFLKLVAGTESQALRHAFFAEREAAKVPDVPPDTPLVISADPVRLKQVLFNLLWNAIKFTPPGGKVHVMAHQGEDGAFVLKVRDTGIGMTPQEVAIAQQPGKVVAHPVAIRYVFQGDAEAAAAQAAAEKAAADTPKRSAFIYLANGVHSLNYQILKDGKDYEFSRSLKPLEKHRGVITPISGLHHPGSLGHHHNCISVWLTGAKIGPSERNTISVDQKMAEITAPLLPADRPRYVMGVGMPGELPEYVARGVDMMDCVLPSRNARNGYLFTSAGQVIIKQAQYKEDPRPVDENCQCYTCQNFSRAYLRHLYLAREITFSVLATLHNIRRYLDIMREIRQSILIGKLPELLKKLRAGQVANARQ